MFCLDLQNLKCSVLSFDKCKAIAAKYGIRGDQDVLHLLQFLHLRMGVIQHFDVDGLRHIVVKEPQVLFNKVTNLIIKTFSREALTTKEQEDFERGILTASVFESVVSGEDKITCKDFLKLLVHLRIITPYPSLTEDRYFLPCVLNHVQESNEKGLRTDISPLSIQFHCKHCPKGLFGVLITHLMTPESEHDNTAFTLLQDKIFKDQVSFEVHSHADQDEISLKISPSTVEINFFPSCCEDRDQLIGETCNSVREIIEASVLRSLEDLHYNKHSVQPVMCLRCEHCSELHQVKKGRRCHKVYCSKSHTNARIPSQGRCWYNENQNEEPASAAAVAPPTRLSKEALTSVTEKLAPYSYKWRKIGEGLCFTADELNNIEARPSLFVEAPSSYLSAMLSDWWHWAPGDTRGSSSYATLESLRAAVDRAGLGRTAQSLDL